MNETTTTTHPRHTVAEIVPFPCVPVFYVGVCGCGWESIGQDTVREAVTEVRAHIATM